MVIKIEVSQRGQHDLRQIYFQGAEDHGIDQADRYRDQMLEIFRLIAEFPFAGVPVDDMSGETRSYLFKSHRIVYRIRPGKLPPILRVLHARQLPPDAL